MEKRGLIWNPNVENIDFHFSLKFHLKFSILDVIFSVLGVIFSTPDIFFDT